MTADEFEHGLEVIELDVDSIHQVSLADVILSEGEDYMALAHISQGSILKSSEI